MVYAFIGENIHAIRERIRKLQESNTGFDVKRIDGESVTYTELIQELTGQSLFGGEVFAIIKNLSKNADLKNKIEKTVENIDKNSVCVLVEAEVDKRTKFYKDLKKLTKLEEFKELNPPQAAEFVKSYVRQKKGTISSADAMYLVSRVGVEQSLLANELDKLLLFNKDINKGTIDELTEPTLQESVFQLTDAITARNTKLALEIYSSLRQQQIHPMEIMGTLSWHIHSLTQIFFNVSSGSPQTIARTIGLHPFVVEKNLGLVKKMNKKTLQNFIDSALEADLSLKTKNLDPDDVIEALLVKLCK